MSKHFTRSISGGSTGSNDTSNGTSTAKNNNTSRSQTNTSTSRTMATSKYTSSSGKNKDGHQFIGVCSSNLDHRRHFVTTSNNKPIAKNMVMSYTTNLDNYRHKSTGTSPKTTTTLSTSPPSFSSNLKSRGSSSCLSAMTRK